VQVNGVTVELQQRVFKGHRVRVRLVEPPDKLLLAEPLPLDVLYEDPWLIVVNKPPGLVAHPCGDLLVRPPGRGHLVEDAHVAGLEVVLEEVACLLPLLPQRSVRVVHRRLPLQQTLVLRLQQGHDQLALRAEVVVDLAQRDRRSFRDPTRRQGGVADLEQRLLDAYPQKEKARFIEPEEVSELIWFLAQPAAKPAMTSCATSCRRGSRVV
jgi:hypothetical protein